SPPGPYPRGRRASPVIRLHGDAGYFTAGLPGAGAYGGFTSQIRTALLLDARQLPSGLNATSQTATGWPRRVRSSRPVSASHTIATLSLPPIDSRRPSGLNVMLVGFTA